MYNSTGYVDIVAPIDFNDLKNYSWGNEPNGALLNADYFGSKFTSVPDPQCAAQVTQLQKPEYDNPNVRTTSVHVKCAGADRSGRNTGFGGSAEMVLQL